MALKEIPPLLLIIMCLAPKNGVEGVLPEEADLNKPIAKIIQSEDGDIFDCVDINQQPSFQHSLLRNHKVQMNPSITSCATEETTPTKNISKAFLNEWCPTGTVPIRRIHKKYWKRMKSYHDIQRQFANPVKSFDATSGIRYHEAGTMGVGKYYGTQAFVNIWNPKVSNNQFSSALIWLHNDPQSETIQVGWTVNPGIYGDKHTRLFTSWIAGNKQGCVDLHCPGFIQVSKKLPVGVAIKTVSIYDGPNYEMKMAVTKDAKTGNWWLVVDKEAVGYWPKNLFTGLNDGTSFLRWEGVVFSPTNEAGPPMGSGHGPFELFRKACYIRHIMLVDEGYKFIEPDRNATVAISDNTQCYLSFYDPGNDGYWECATFFGGSGDCTT